MNCPICNQEMIEGKIKNYEMFNPISPATLKFEPNDKSKKSVKADHFQEMQGYSCEIGFLMFFVGLILLPNSLGIYLNDVLEFFGYIISFISWMIGSFFIQTASNKK
jgi:hypothetical protein